MLNVYNNIHKTLKTILKVIKMKNQSLKESTTEFLTCTECNKIKLIAVSMELKPVPSIKKRICNDCLETIDGSNYRFDWDLWLVK